MFKNLRAEMARQGIKGKQIAAAMGISERAFSNRMKRKPEFLFREMLQIRETFFKGLELPYLFAEMLTESPQNKTVGCFTFINDLKSVN